MPANPRVWAVIPAAGLSRRMGVPKLSLPFGESTLIGTVVRTLLRVDLAGVVVVTRRALVECLDLPSDRRLVATFHDSDEMIDSIRAGLWVLDGLAVDPLDGTHPVHGVLVTPADMPTIPESTFRACLAAFADDPRRVVIAGHAGRRGHPMIFPFAFRHIVAGLTHGLRELAELYEKEVHLVDIGDSDVHADIDTWEQYARLRPPPFRGTS